MVVGDAKETSGPAAAESADKPKRSEGSASFLRAARAGNLDKLLEFLKGNFDINTSNANGLNALHLSSKDGHVKVVEELLSRGADVNASTKKGNTALHIASLAGQEEVVRVLVKNGAQVNIQSQNGFTPLYMAAQENHVAVVKQLLEEGAQQSIATEDGFTPLAVALQQGNEKVVALLLESDVKGRVRLPALHVAAKKDDTKSATLLLFNQSPDLTTKSGFTPLHIAAHYGNTNVAAVLVQHNADTNFKAKNGITPLHVASKWGRMKMITLLLENGAVLDETTKDGLSALHCASRSGYDRAVDVLLEKNANHSIKTRSGLTPLHMAAQGDHVDCARLLLYYDAPVDDVTVDYLTALHVAAHCGNVRIAKLLLDRKCEPNARALNGFTPLHIACKKNRIKVIELLLKYQANIEATTESGLTPLHVASFMGHMDIAVYLLQHGANPDTQTVRGETSLHLAARANQTDIMRVLLRNRADVNARAREQLTPLHISARMGSVENVQLLLQHNAKVNAETRDGYTPLHIAAKEGQEETAAELLEHGADTSVKTAKGFTPLHIAAKYGKLNVVRLLLDRGSDPDMSGKNGLTALHVAAHYNNPAVASLLLDYKASPHCVAKNGYTPLHIAAKKNEIDLATTLLENNARPDDKSKSGFSPLHLATQEGHKDMVALLLKHNASVNCKANNGLTAMHLAAQEDHVPVAEVLVQYNAEIDPKTKAGYTPLHTACHFGQINMIRFLLQHGASVDSTTGLGYTPLHQAAQQGHTMVINLLLKHDANPNTASNNGQTAMDIADQLGYISVVEVLKNVTTAEPRGEVAPDYSHQTPETMQETFMSDSEDEADESTQKQREPETTRGAAGSHPSLQYLTETPQGTSLLHGSEDNLGESFHEMERMVQNPNTDGTHVYDIGDLSYTRNTLLSQAPRDSTLDSGRESILEDPLSAGPDSAFVTEQFRFESTPRDKRSRREVMEHIETSPVRPVEEPMTRGVHVNTSATAPDRPAPMVNAREMLGSGGTDEVDEVELRVKPESLRLSDAEYAALSPSQRRSLPPQVREQYDLRLMYTPADPARFSRDLNSIDSFIEEEPMLTMSRSPQQLCPVPVRPSRVTPRRDVRGSYVGSVLPDTTPDNVSVEHSPVSNGFLVSFMVDARGGAMRGCRYPGVRVIVPPRTASGPTRVLCRLVKKDKLLHPPPLCEGEGLAARILETGPQGTQFLGPVVIEVPHFSALRGGEREVVVMRCDDGENWYEHPLEANTDTVKQILSDSLSDIFDDEGGRQVTRIVTTDFPHFFALVTRVRQDKMLVGEQGGVIKSSVVPGVQAMFPEAALSKTIAIGLQAQPVPADLVTKLLGNRVAVSPIVTIEPRRRKFRKPVTVTIPVPQAAGGAGMINTYTGGDSATLRLLCSITGGTTPSQWQDVTNSTALTYQDGCVSFTTNISARFWLVDCQNTSESASIASQLHSELCAVPYNVKFGVFARRLDQRDGQLRCFAFTDDRSDKSLEKQEHFTEVARSREVQVLDGRLQYMEMAGNLIPVTKSGQQLSMDFSALSENRLTFPVRVRDTNQDATARLAFFTEPREVRESAAKPAVPVCSLDVALPQAAVSRASSLADESERAGLEHQLADARNMAVAVNRQADNLRSTDRPALTAEMSLDVEYDENDLTKESESVATSLDREHSMEAAALDEPDESSGDSRESVREDELAAEDRSAEREAVVSQLVTALQADGEFAAPPASEEGPNTPPATPAHGTDVKAEPPHSDDVAERLAEEGFEEDSDSSAAEEPSEETRREMEEAINQFMKDEN